MAPLDDNSVLSKGTSFYVGSWIFVADGSGGFDSHPINRDAPKTSEAARRQEIDNFVDQLEEIELPVDNEARNQPNFKTISPKTLTELEEDLDKLLDDTKPKTQLDKYLTESHPTTDSLPIQDYMGRWCNFIQVPSSPTPQESHHMPQLISTEERDNLNRYDKFMNEFSVRIEGGWPPADTLPYDEDLLRHTLGLSPRNKSSNEFYLDPDQVHKRNRVTQESISDKRTESNKKLVSANTTRREHQFTDQTRKKRQFSEYKELPFQQGLPLKDDKKSKIPNPDREIFMAIPSESEDRKENPTAREDLDYDNFLFDIEVAETTAINYEILPPPLGVTVTVYLDDNHDRPTKTHNQKRNIKYNLMTEHHQQLGDSFDYSNSDLHNVFNIGRNAKTVIINRREDHEEFEAYSPTSNYRLPNNYEYNSQK